VAGGVGVSPPLAPAPVITMLLGEWRALLEAGRRLEEVSTQNRGQGKYANHESLRILKIYSEFISDTKLLSNLFYEKKPFSDSVVSCFDRRIFKKVLHTFCDLHFSSVEVELSIQYNNYSVYSMCANLKI
jgi:hypothetical protein